MPNYCYNNLTIKGNNDELKKFVEFVKSDDTEFDFNNFISDQVSKDEHKPEWDSLSKKDKDRWLIDERDETQAFHSWWFNSYGYDWRVKNWDTKWNAVDINIDKLDDTMTSINISFDTAWSPPMKVFRKMIEKFDNLQFSIEGSEEGNSFGFEIEGKRGQITKDDIYDIDEMECPNCEIYITKRRTENKFYCEGCDKYHYDKTFISNYAYHKIRDNIKVTEIEK